MVLRKAIEPLVYYKPFIMPVFLAVTVCGRCPLLSLCTRVHRVMVGVLGRVWQTHLPE